VGGPGFYLTERTTIMAQSNQSSFYLNRADEERTKADAAQLANVRDGHLRAAAAWDLLAARSVKSDRLREEEERRKSEVGRL
jgi:hypothetical protein